MDKYLVTVDEILTKRYLVLAETEEIARSLVRNNIDCYYEGFGPYYEVYPRFISDDEKEAALFDEASGKVILKKQESSECSLHVESK